MRTPADQETTKSSKTTNIHRGPNLGALAVVCAVLFNLGLGNKPIYI